MANERTDERWEDEAKQLILEHSNERRKQNRTEPKDNYSYGGICGLKPLKALKPLKVRIESAWQRYAMKPTQLLTHSFIH